MIEPEFSSIGLVRDAATEVYNRRNALMRAVVVPVLGILTMRALSVLYVRSTDVEHLSFAVIYGLALAGIPFFVMFATACHRIVLLGNNSLTNRWGLFWSMRETRFAGWIFVLGVISFVASMPLWFMAWVLPEWTFDWPLTTIIMFLSTIISTFIDGRLSLVLPATAIGERTTLVDSWRASVGHSWRILIALSIPILATWVIDFALFNLIFKSNFLVVTFFRQLLLYPLIMVEVVVITLAYRNLMQHAGGEGPPKPRRKFYFEQ